MNLREQFDSKRKRQNFVKESFGDVDVRLFVVQRFSPLLSLQAERLGSSKSRKEHDTNGREDKRGPKRKIRRRVARQRSLLLPSIFSITFAPPVLGWYQGRRRGTTMK